MVEQVTGTSPMKEGTDIEYLEKSIETARNQLSSVGGQRDTETFEPLEFV